MGDWGSAVVMRLEAREGVVDGVGDRIDWTTSAPGAVEPRMVLTTASDNRPDHYQGADMRATRLQVDVYSARSAGEATAIVEEAIAALQPEETVGGVRFDRAEVEGPVDSGEQRTVGYLYRSRADIILKHAPEA